MSKAIHIIYKEDSKPEVILDGTFTVKEINIVPKFVNIISLVLELPLVILN